MCAVRDSELLSARVKEIYKECRTKHVRASSFTDARPPRPNLSTDSPLQRLERICLSGSGVISHYQDASPAGEPLATKAGHDADRRAARAPCTPSRRPTHSTRRGWTLPTSHRAASMRRSCPRSTKRPAARAGARRGGRRSAHQRRPRQRRHRAAPPPPPP